VLVEDLPADLARDLPGNFERLVVAYQDRLYAFALRLTGSPPDAEEIAQDAFVRAYRALGRYPAAQVRTLALRPWLYQITLNVVRNHRRVRRASTVPLGRPGDDDAGLDLRDAEGDRPEAVLERRETRRDLAALLLTLPERYRVSVVLRHVEGLGYAELATLLGHPVGTVKSDVHRGTRLLREALAAEGSALIGRSRADGLKPRVVSLRG
jgi:RNA polymerase sigma-70 factor (ECF subfamily)